MKTNTLLVLGLSGAAIYLLTRKRESGMAGLAAMSPQDRTCQSAQKRVAQIHGKISQMETQIAMRMAQAQRFAAQLEPQIEKAKTDLGLAMQAANASCGKTPFPPNYPYAKRG